MRAAGFGSKADYSFHRLCKFSSHHARPFFLLLFSTIISVKEGCFSVRNSYESAGRVSCLQGTSRQSRAGNDSSNDSSLQYRGLSFPPKPRPRPRGGELALRECFTGSSTFGFNTTWIQHFIRLRFNTPIIQ